MNRKKQFGKPGTVAVDERALVALAQLLAPYLGAALGSVPAGDASFSSIELPPHTSRRAFRERCQAIATAKKVGHVWYCPAVDWWASARRAPAMAPASPISTTRGPTADELVDEAIRAAGLRPTRAA